MEFETLAIHAGQEPDLNTGAVMTPIYQTSTYIQDGVGKARDGYEYSRTKNPTRLALEKCLAALEGGSYGLAFASGMAATDTVLRLVDSGAHVLAGNDVYGGTFRLFDKILKRYGLNFNFSQFPYLGIWAAKNADFVCIEPWCGIADSVDSNQQIKDKEGINKLNGEEIFERSWNVSFY